MEDSYQQYKLYKHLYKQLAGNPVALKPNETLVNIRYLDDGYPSILGPNVSDYTLLDESRYLTKPPIIFSLKVDKNKDIKKVKESIVKVLKNYEKNPIKKPIDTSKPFSIGDFVKFTYKSHIYGGGYYQLYGTVSELDNSGPNVKGVSKVHCFNYRQYKSKIYHSNDPNDSDINNKPYGIISVDHMTKSELTPTHIKDKKNNEYNICLFSTQHGKCKSKQLSDKKTISDYITPDKPLSLIVIPQHTMFQSLKLKAKRYM